MVDIHIPKFKERRIQLSPICGKLGGDFRKVEAFRGRRVPGSSRPEKFQALMRATGRVIEEFGSKRALDNWVLEHGSRLYNFRHIAAQPEIIHEERGSRHLLASMPNIITNNGLDLKGDTANFLGACSVGTGTTPEAVTDSALVSWSAENDSVESTTTGARSSSPYKGYQTRIYRFDPPGSNKSYTELGIHPPAATTDLWSRALTKVAGSPTAIAVDADEWLDVTYDAQLLPYALSQTVDGGTVDGYDLTYGALDVDFVSPGGWGDAIDEKMDAFNPATANRWIGYSGASFLNVTSPMQGTQLNIIVSGTSSAGSYTTSTYSIDYNYHATIDQLNGQITGAQFNSPLGLYGALFDPYINKTSSDVLDIGITYTWTRGTAV